MWHIYITCERTEKLGRKREETDIKNEQYICNMNSWPGNNLETDKEIQVKFTEKWNALITPAVDVRIKILPGT